MTVMAEDLAATTNVDGNTAQTITPRLREHLRKVAEQRLPVTYLEAAKALGLRPPNTIRQVTEALEHLMTEDAATDRPFIAVSLPFNQPGPNSGSTQSSMADMWIASGPWD